MLRFNFPKYISTPDIEGGGEEKNAEDANLLARAKMWTGSIRNGVDGAAAKKTKQKKTPYAGLRPKILHLWAHSLSYSPSTGTVDDVEVGFFFVL